MPNQPDNKRTDMMQPAQCALRYMEVNINKARINASKAAR